MRQSVNKFLSELFNMLIDCTMSYKTYECVCRCAPGRGIFVMHDELFTQVVEREQARIARTPNLRQRAMRALRLGDLCHGTGHTSLAIDIWQDAITTIARADYAEWIDVNFNPRFATLEQVTARHELTLLGGRIDEALRRQGHLKHAGNRHAVNRFYRDLWLDKYYESLP